MQRPVRQCGVRAVNVDATLVDEANAEMRLIDVAREADAYDAIVDNDRRRFDFARAHLATLPGIHRSSGRAGNSSRAVT